jgi:DNA-directed RNA polymerase subunit M/transcription elongation factor TFIIS
MGLDNIIEYTFPLALKFYESNYNNNRRRILLSIGDILYKSDVYNFNKKSDVIEDIERGIYDSALSKCLSYNLWSSWQNNEFVKIYNVIAYKVLTNLDPKSMIGSSYLYNSVMEETIDPKQIAEMDSLDLCPNKHIDIIERINSRKEQKIEYRFSKLVKCRQCKKLTCIERTIQTRSGDEAATKFYECIICKIKMRE